MNQEVVNLEKQRLSTLTHATPKKTHVFKHHIELHWYWMHRGKSTGSFSPAVLTSQLLQSSATQHKFACQVVRSELFLTERCDQCDVLEAHAILLLDWSGPVWGVCWQRASRKHDSHGGILRVLAISKFSKFPWSDFWCHTISSIQSTSSIHYKLMKLMYHVIQLISYHLLFFKSLLVLANLSDFWVIKICELGAEQIPLSPFPFRCGKSTSVVWDLQRFLNLTNSWWRFESFTLKLDIVGMSLQHSLKKHSVNYQKG